MWFKFWGTLNIPASIPFSDLEALNIDVSNRLELVKVKSPPVRGGSVKMLQDSNQLIDVLKNKEGIL